jgi:hypothetical protein
LNKKKPKTTKTKTKKMAIKPTRITDVASPGKTPAPATSRPIVVTNHTTMAGDPMINEASVEKPAESLTAPIVSRTAKTIAPVSPDMQPQESTSVLQPLQQQNPAATPDQGSADAVPVPPTEAPAPIEESVPKEAASSMSDVAPSSDIMVERDEAADEVAEASKLSAEEVARQQKLEQLIEERTYAVPINAVRRHRSHVFVAAMCIFALLLAVVLLDMVLDTGLLKPPFDVPHTHIFSNI